MPLLTLQEAAQLSRGGALRSHSISVDSPRKAKIAWIRGEMIMLSTVEKVARACNAEGSPLVHSPQLAGECV